MTLDIVHIVQGIHHGLKSGPETLFFVMKITEGSACMDRHL